MVINNNTVFDFFYDDYDIWYTTKIGAFVDALETDACFSLLNNKPNQKVLDVGCGTGNFTYKLEKQGLECVGIDISIPMLNIAKSKQKKNHNLSFYQMNGEQINFPDNHFDHVISITAFEFMKEPSLIYEEMKRVVKPGGNIIIGTIQKGGTWYDLYTSEVCKGTAYAKATFKSKEDIIVLDHTNYVSHQECLWIPPLLEESAYTLENENLYKKQLEIGGFVCVKFQKKI